MCFTDISASVDILYNMVGQILDEFEAVVVCVSIRKCYISRRDFRFASAITTQFMTPESTDRNKFESYSSPNKQIHQTYPPV